MKRQWQRWRRRQEKKSSIIFIDALQEKVLKRVIHTVKEVVIFFFRLRSHFHAMFSIEIKIVNAMKVKIVSSPSELRKSVCHQYQVSRSVDNWWLCKFGVSKMNNSEFPWVNRRLLASSLSKIQNKLSLKFHESVESVRKMKMTKIFYDSAVFSEKCFIR